MENLYNQKEMEEITDKLIQLRRHTNVKLESVLGNLQGNNSAEKLELLLKKIYSNLPFPREIVTGFLKD